MVAASINLAKHGHITALIKAHLRKHNMRNAHLAHQISGDPKRSTIVHAWADGRCAPSEVYRDNLAKVLGVAPWYLQARQPGTPAPDLNLARKGLKPLGPNVVVQATPIPVQALRIRRKGKHTVRQALERLPAVLTASPGTVSRPHANSANSANNVTNNVLSYQANGDGTANITLRAKLPVDVAKPLFRMLMDTNIDLEPVDENWGRGTIAQPTD